MTVDVQIENEKAIELADDANLFVLNFAENALLKLGKQDQDISIVVSDDDFLFQLNKQFLGKSAPTNVLAFPFEGNESAYIGDIAISFDTILRESDCYNIEIKEHFAHILLHGLLHLLGYNHIKPEDAVVMEKLESEVMTSFGYNDPHEVSRET